MMFLYHCYKRLNGSPKHLKKVTKNLPDGCIYYKYVLLLTLAYTSTILLMLDAPKRSDLDPLHRGAAGVPRQRGTARWCEKTEAVNLWDETLPANCWWYLYIGTTPQPVTVTTRILPFLVGNPYKSFVTVTGWGVDLTYTWLPGNADTSTSRKTCWFTVFFAWPVNFSKTWYVDLYTCQDFVSFHVK